MTPKSQYLIEILDKIGAPLLRSVGRVAAPEASDADQAKAMAELLSRAVQTSIDMGQSFNFSEMPDQGDSVRVALAALAGPLVAEQYTQTGRMPTETDMKKVVTVLQSVLTFSENFAPSVENAQRLSDLKAKGAPVDAPQADLQYIEAFVPVVQAVSGFSFGQPENKLALDIADRLVKHAVEMRESQYSHVTDADEQKRIEIVMAGALADLYAGAHRAVMDSAINAAQSGATPPTIEAVWQKFDVQAAMIETMLSGLLPGSALASSAPKPAPVVEVEPPVQSDASAAPAIFQTTPEAMAESGAPQSTVPETPIEPDSVIDTAPQAPEIFSAPPEAEPEKAEDVPIPAPIEIPDTASESPPASAPAGGVNPMAMFAKPKTDDEAAPVPAAPESGTASQDAPVAETAPASPISQVVEKKTEAVTSEPSESSDDDTQGEGGGAANPMSFFKTGGD